MNTLLWANVAAPSLAKLRPTVGRRAAGHRMGGGDRVDAAHVRRRRQAERYRKFWELSFRHLVARGLTSAGTVGSMTGDEPRRARRGGRSNPFGTGTAVPAPLRAEA